MKDQTIQDTKEFLYQVQKEKLLQGVTAKTEPIERKNVLNLKILVCVDISGSISPSQYAQFMRQIDAIKGLSVVKVLETDSKVVALYDFIKAQPQRVLRLMGGGGTEFKEAFEVAKKMKPDAILFMTDGDVFDSVSDPKIPTGWVLTHDGKMPYGFGEVVLTLPAV